jgi:3-deoxy-manno-octulosonate cytidylyltransferase (CMP-KDO synthetase)
LQFYNETSKSLLEKAEENDLIRFIENRIPVMMIHSPYKTVSVDTPKDLELVRKEIGRNRNKYE